MRRAGMRPGTGRLKLVMSTTSVLEPVDVAVLRSRAADLRHAAAGLGGPLAATYRRRAAELELEATALAARLGLVEDVPLAA